MALEMKIPKEITAYEAKPMFGRTWRQLAALVYMVVIGGGVFALVSILLATSQGGTSEAWNQATTIAMFVMLPVILPAAWWGWFRPKGLKPEVFALYFLRHHLMRTVLTYEDTFRHDTQEPVREPAERRGRQGRTKPSKPPKPPRAVSEHEPESAR